jgi:hypothetical protein
MAYNNLVVNGCSYMQAYAQGGGHQDLAQRLGIPKSQSLAIGGSANTRIMRTVLKHSYLADEPTFYVLGMTFLSRLEVPILKDLSNFEGRWINPQNQEFKDRWEHHWTEQDSNTFVEIKLKTEVYSILDRLEDLQYRMLSLVHDLRSRGHGAIVYQQADSLYQEFLDDAKMAPIATCPEIVLGYRWRAVAWQLENDVPPMNYGQNTRHRVPADMHHPAPGHHQKLNEFLTNYISDQGLLK